MQFPIEKSQVVWGKGSLTEDDREAIKNSLRKIAVEMQQAVEFTAKLRYTIENEVKFWLETGTEKNYTLSINFDLHAGAWGMLIEDQENGNVVGEIACIDPITFQFIEKENILKKEPLVNP